MSYAFTFEPMSDEELNSAFLLPKGTYDFSVHDFQMSTSKAGNPMIQLSIRILQGNVTYTVYDYLVNSPASQFKVKNFCYAVGKEDEYNAGYLNPDRSWLGMRGQCKIDVKAGNPKLDGSGENWPDKNVVADYIRRENAQILTEKKPEGLTIAKKGAVEFNDEIPF